jgi:lipopolysaccharide export system protein LptA
MMRRSIAGILVGGVLLTPMRRISAILAVAAILLAAAVAFTYKLRRDRELSKRLDIAPQIEKGVEHLADRGWTWDKSDPITNKPVVHLSAKSSLASSDPSTLELRDLKIRLYSKDATKYTYVSSSRARYDERSGIMKSEGDVHLAVDVPADKRAEDPAQVAKQVQVETSGVTYETKTGKADSDQPAKFKFGEGGGEAVGVAYDPNTGDLQLKTKVSLDFVGHGPAENKMHVEAGNLVYKEREQKVYLSPWSKLQRQTTVIQAKNSLVTLEDGVLKQIDSDHAFGTDDREDKKTNYSADKMTALFDENGALVNIVGLGQAHVTSTQATSRTTITGDRADLRFAVATRQIGALEVSESDLHLVLADGHAAAKSEPLPQPGVLLADTRLLRSEHIELEMKAGGKDVQEIRTPSQAQLEFQPNRADQAHRVLDAARLRIFYGEGSYIDSFQAWKVATHTDRPKSVQKSAKDGKQPCPALTWSDELVAKFIANSNQVATIEQTGNFRYEEGSRKATAKRAYLEQNINRITLFDQAHVSDENGSALADKIVMNQANGDMDALGHVVSSHAPDKNERPGTSMLDNTKTMQAKSDQMQTRDNNSKIFYEGHAVIWQGANRISANVIHIDRDEQILEANGKVVSELVDDKADGASPVFTVVHAPHLAYRDDTRIADYTGGVKLERAKMTVTSGKLQAFLTPKSQTDKDQSSLDHAFADEDVKIYDVLATGRTRTGTSQHCEYFTSDDKVILNGGAPQMLDSYKGVTKGRQLTYFSDDDRLLVDGEKKALAYTQMKKR